MSLFSHLKNGHKSGEGPGFVGVKIYTILGPCLRKKMQIYEYKISYKTWNEKKSHHKLQIKHIHKNTKTLYNYKNNILTYLYNTFSYLFFLANSCLIIFL